MAWPTKCKHGKTEYTCVDCNGKGICIHKRNKAYCKECKGSGLCAEHLKCKRACVLCHKKAEIKIEEQKKDYKPPIWRGGVIIRK